MIKWWIAQDSTIVRRDKTIVYNVYDYFTTLYKKGQSDRPFKRTADAMSEPYFVTCFYLLLRLQEYRKLYNTYIVNITICH